MTYPKINVNTTTNKNDFIISKNTFGKSTKIELNNDDNTNQYSSKSVGLIPTLTKDQKPGCQTIAKQKPIRSIENIWDDSHIHKLEKGWKCLWCFLTFSGQDPTRVLSHVAGMRIYAKSDIAFCKSNIPSEKLLLYQNYASRKNRFRFKKEEDSVQRTINNQNSNQNMAIQYLAKKQRKDNTIVSSSYSCSKDLVSDITMKEFEPPSQIQTKLDFVNNNPKFIIEKVEMDIAIADFIHSKGLPFRLAEDIKFKQLLIQASKTSPSYEPPKRKEISGDLLNTIYGNYVDKSKSLLNVEVHKYGLSIMGDGATIKKKPLFNVIVSGVSCPIFVADVHDASYLLALGETKNAKYITKLCQEVIESIDPGQIFFDLALFDGASVVQTAGICLQFIYPRISVIHGAEHVVALFCSNLLQKTEVGKLVRVYRILYKYFGQGCTHMSYAQFKNHSCIDNNQRPIGLIQAAETRMGGYFYAFYRLLRLRKSLKQTIVADEWENVKFGNKYAKLKIEEIINNDDYFNLVKMVVIVLYPVIMCLRLADSNTPGMDKIWYYARQIRKRIDGLAQEFNEAFDNEFIKKNSDNEGTDDSDEDLDENQDIVANNIDENKLLEETDMEFPDTFGDQILKLWKIRESQLKSDYAVAGWILSVDCKIFDDAKNHTQEDVDTLRRVASKLFSHLGKETENYVNKCMAQFTHFRHKDKCFANTDWWLVEYVHLGQSHLWHGNYTILYCKELAYVACKVTSKLLGIGNCERQWDKTKSCALGRHALMSSEKLKKQSIIYGAHCIENGRVSNDESIVNWAAIDWCDVKLREELELFMDEHEPKQRTLKSTISKLEIDLFSSNEKPIRYFHAYLEDWEKEVVHDSEKYKSECKLLAKYRNLKWVWPEDTTYAATISSHGLVYCGKEDVKQGETYGWCVVFIPKGIIFDPELEDKYDADPIDSDDDLHMLIAATKQDPDVVCIDKNGKELIPDEVFYDNFPNLEYMPWEAFPANTKLNCNPLTWE
jgi:hypothetical protein